MLTWNGAIDHSFAVRSKADGERIICLCPLLLFPGSKPFSIFRSRLEATGGPAIDQNLSERAINSLMHLVRVVLLEEADKTSVVIVDLSFPPLAPAYVGGENRVNPAALIGCEDTSTHSWIVDLREHNQETLWQKIEHRSRKAVNKARRNGMVVRTASAQDLDAYLKLHRESCARLGIPEKPAAYFQSIFTTHLEQGNALILAGCDADGTVHALHTFAIAKGAALYWTVASDEIAMQLGLNNLVQWEAMVRFLDMGLSFYENGEAFPGYQSGKLKRISDFKKGFGADLHPYFRGTLITREVVYASIQLAKAILRKRGQE
ncbi:MULTISPECIES: peptidoglycan bridge formation glycyltransferase FemA/FemB family protein [Rhodospirillales]|uniref:peptidoglycan bridge formation glycyltransferase FemA/FemB family protein n=1 Tax=Rhodospirillales TaxID=204441 RepID=UPI0030EBC96B|tara:strand:- start:31613 stop:32569 length:957 start_codon:yes stop_codon:yes gene_type:complete